MSQQINLLGQSFRRQKPSITSAVGIVGGIGIVIVLTAIFGVYEMVRLTHLETQAHAIAQKYAEVKARADPAPGTAPKTDPALEARLVELTNELRARQDVIDALKRGTVGATGGFSEFMRAFSRRRVEGVWLTGFDITYGGAGLTIAGRALNTDLVPAYLKGLNSEPPMQGRQFASVTITRPVPKSTDAKDAQTLPAAPAYLDFVISSENPQEPRTAGAKAVAPSLALRAPLEAEMKGRKAPSP